jgi:group I intron endonuclease
MKLYKQRDFKKCGIYCIKNTVNNKCYIGKSVNIYERIRQHINKLNKRSKDENRYFINSWHKYGRESFEYFVLEYCDKDNDLLKEKEMYYMKFYNTIDRNLGYNLRMDSATSIIINAETRLKLSIAHKKRFSKPEEREKARITGIRVMTPELRLQISKSVTITKAIHDFYQYDKNMNLLNIYTSVADVIQKNPSFKWQNIYAACNGNKPTYMKCIWQKKLKI